MLQAIYSLQKVLYDEERGIEYSPLKCMNNDEYAKVCSDPNAPACIFAINGTQSLNSEIATSFRKKLVEGKIDFLVNFNVAKEDILSQNPDYENELDENMQMLFENPFLETQAMITECADLQYEKNTNNIIKVFEKGSNRKDRYSACSYGSYFFDYLEKNNGSSSSDYDFVTFIN